MVTQGQSAIFLTSTPTVQNTLDTSKAITEYGILVVISGIFLVVAFYILRRMISSYTNLIDEIIPKVEETSKAVDELRASMNEMMSAHNAHTNQSLRSIEKSTKEICDKASQEYISIAELSSSLKSMQTNYDTLLKIMVSGTTTNNTRSHFMEGSGYREVPYQQPEIVYTYDNKKGEEESK